MGARTVKVLLNVFSVKYSDRVNLEHCALNYLTPLFLGSY